MFSGNQFLIPLVGGSGGGGARSGSSTFCDGGGAGGGALLVASSTQITVNGNGINANGGDFGGGCIAGGGSGGAIRLVSNTIAGSGALVARGGNGFQFGGPGLVRLEATNLTYAGQVVGMGASSTPFPLLLPRVGPPSAKIISVAGTSIVPNPNTFPDITINTTATVPVVIQTHNIPTTATINLTILDQNGVPDTVIPAPPLGNCDPDNFCTTTVDAVFPFGASRGLTKVTWTQ